MLEWSVGCMLWNQVVADFVEVALHQRVAMAGQEAASVVEQKVETR